MLKKMLKGFLSLLIIVGICLTISNFIPELDAGGIFGTETTIENPAELEYYIGIYGPEGMADRWLGFGQTYCLDYASDCVIIEA